MALHPDSAESPSLADFSYLLLQKIPKITRIDDLITLCCSTLKASLFIHDTSGKLLFHSPLDQASCPAWSDHLKSGYVKKKSYLEHQNFTPFSNNMKKEICGGHSCTRLYFPINADVLLSPHILTIFIWDRAVTYEDQCLASVFAGAFSSLLLNSQDNQDNLHLRQLQLLQELLDYKHGLLHYYQQTISSLGLSKCQKPYRVFFLHPDTLLTQNTSSLIQELSFHFPESWCFFHKENILLLLNEEGITVQSACDMLYPVLTLYKMKACVSAPFFDLTRLHLILEDCCSVFPLAEKKNPVSLIHYQEHHQCLAFLSRCQRHFPLTDCFPEGLAHLIDYDRTNERSYVSTLSTYLNNNMNANAAAKQLFLHRNTILQQIAKAEEIMNLSLDDVETRQYIQLCLKIHELLEI